MNCNGLTLTWLLRAWVVLGVLLAPAPGRAQTPPTISVESLRVGEINSRTEFSIKLSAPSTTAVTGRFSIVESSGEAELHATGGAACADGVDFVEIINQEFHFEPGVVTLPVPVTLCPDLVFEQNEQYLMRIEKSGLKGAVCGVGINARCASVPEIIDDDSARRSSSVLRVQDASVNEPESGQANGRVRIGLSHSLRETDVSFDYKVMPFTATDKGQIPPPLQMIGPAVGTSNTCDQTFRTLNASGTRPARAPEVLEPGRPVGERPPVSPVGTLNPTVVLRRDFIPATGTLVIPAGQVSVELNVVVCSDGLKEEREGIRIVISNARQGTNPTGMIAHGRAVLSIGANGAR